MSTSMDLSKTCRKCGKKNASSEVICRSCGKPLETESTRIGSHLDESPDKANAAIDPSTPRKNDTTPVDTPASDSGVKKPEVGVQQIGRFKLVRFLGAGGMGEVHLAQHHVTSELVALKVIREKLATTPEVRKRFLKEALVMMRIQHPNVVRVRDIDEEGNHLFFTMEYLTGCSLKELIREYRKRKRHIPFQKTLSLMEQICRGLEAAHKKGIVHRDLKPGNVIVSMDREPDVFDPSKKVEFVIAELFDANSDAALPDESVKVLDFGLAKMLGLGDETVVGQQLGTPYYMAPEQLEGQASQVDARADVYSLGIMFYELLTNKLPTGLNSALPSKVREDVPVDVDRLISQCSESDPSDRYESTTAVLKEIMLIQKAEEIRLAEKAKADAIIRKRAEEQHQIEKELRQQQIEEERIREEKERKALRDREETILKLKESAQELEAAGQYEDAIEKWRSIQKISDADQDSKTSRDRLKKLIQEREDTKRVMEIERAQAAEQERKERRRKAAEARQARQAAETPKREEQEIRRQEGATRQEKLETQQRVENEGRMRKLLLTGFGLAASILAIALIFQIYQSTGQSDNSVSSSNKVMFTAPPMIRVVPTSRPTQRATLVPTSKPRPSPSITAQPTSSPTLSPTAVPTKKAPAIPPAIKPTTVPKSKPTVIPSPTASSKPVAPKPKGYVYIKPGKFEMGSPTSETGREKDETQPNVTLTRGFWMKETEVTQSEWESVMMKNPSNFKGLNRPVERVSWNDCIEFCNKLSVKENLMPCYEGTTWNRSANGYRLPTEAEWEYACRAGTTGAYAGSLGERGWYYSNSGDQTHDVKQKKANVWGLYDMHGNVWEWCWDWKVEYASGSVTDPAGPSSGSFRVVRGGGWGNFAWLCRSASRGRYRPADRDDDLGLRPVRSGD